MQCRGNLLGWTVAAMKPEAQPVHHQDSRQVKAALGCVFTETHHGFGPLSTGASPGRILSLARSVPHIKDVALVALAPT